MDKINSARHIKTLTGLAPVVLSDDQPKKDQKKRPSNPGRYSYSGDVEVVRIKTKA